VTENDEAMEAAFRDFLRAVAVPADGSRPKDRDGALEALDRMEWIGHAASEKENVRILHHGEPIPCPRPRAMRHGHTYMPERYRVYRDGLRIVMMAGRRGRRAPEPPLRVTFRFWMASLRNSDPDNLIKTVLDAGLGVLWPDDAWRYIPVGSWQIGVDKDNPRVEVEVVSL
jgi:Holliday junction resolvase RusA-like endonuclease